MSNGEEVKGCVSTAAGPIASWTEAEDILSEERTKEEKTMTVRVGKEAPDFEASAYFEGGFTNIRLSNYRGKWVFLCFYPGDFTFV